MHILDGDLCAIGSQLIFLILRSFFFADDDGVLNEDEFRRLCATYAPELNTAEEVSAALKLIDTNKDGTIQFTGER